MYEDLRLISRPAQIWSFCKRHFEAFDSVCCTQQNMPAATVLTKLRPEERYPTSCETQARGIDTIGSCRLVATVVSHALRTFVAVWSRA
jgi:hypothetical protein